MVFANSVNATSQGIQYYSSSGIFSGIDAGASGDVLISNGTGVAPSFNLPGFAGDLILISSKSASNSANLIFTLSSSYLSYLLIWSNVVPVTNASILQMQASTNIGSPYLTSGYLSGLNYNAYNTGTSTNINSTSLIYLTNTIDNTSGNGASGQSYFGIIAGINLVGKGAFISSSTLIASSMFASNFNISASIQSFQVYMSSGNISTGTFTLYGVID